MTRTEQKYLFYAIYFTVQGICIIVALWWTYKMLEKTSEDEGHRGEVLTTTLMLLVLAKLANSWGFLYNWGKFIDPSE